MRGKGGGVDTSLIRLSSYNRVQEPPRHEGSQRSKSSWCDSESNHNEYSDTHHDEVVTAIPSQLGKH